MINETTGVAINLLWSLKNALDKTKGTVDFKILKKTGTKNIIFPLKQFESRKDIYDKLQLSKFKEMLEIKIAA